MTRYFLVSHISTNRTGEQSMSQGPSPLATKNHELVLEPCCAWKWVGISSAVDILDSSWVFSFTINEDRDYKNKFNDEHFIHVSLSYLKVCL